MVWNQIIMDVHPPGHSLHGETIQRHACIPLYTIEDLNWGCQCSSRLAICQWTNLVVLTRCKGVVLGPKSRRVTWLILQENWIRLNIELFHVTAVSQHPQKTKCHECLSGSNYIIISNLQPSHYIYIYITHMCTYIHIYIYTYTYIYIICIYMYIYIYIYKMYSHHAVIPCRFSTLVSVWGGSDLHLDQFKLLPFSHPRRTMSANNLEKKAVFPGIPICLHQSEADLPRSAIHQRHSRQVAKVSSRSLLRSRRWPVLLCRLRWLLKCQSHPGPLLLLPQLSHPHRGVPLLLVELSQDLMNTKPLGKIEGLCTTSMFQLSIGKTILNVSSGLCAVVVGITKRGSTNSLRRLVQKNNLNLPTLLLLRPRHEQKPRRRHLRRSLLPRFLVVAEGMGVEGLVRAKQHAGRLAPWVFLAKHQRSLNALGNGFWMIGEIIYQQSWRLVISFNGQAEPLVWNILSTWWGFDWQQVGEHLKASEKTRKLVWSLGLTWPFLFKPNGEFIIH